jgi:hypothetical protein
VNYNLYNGLFLLCVSTAISTTHGTSEGKVFDLRDTNHTQWSLKSNHHNLHCLKLEYTRLIIQNDRKIRNTGRSFRSNKRIYRTEEHVNSTIHRGTWSNCIRPPQNTRHKEQDTHSPKRIQCLLTFLPHFRRICSLPGFFPPPTHCTQRTLRSTFEVTWTLHNRHHNPKSTSSNIHFNCSSTSLSTATCIPSGHE